MRWKSGVIEIAERMFHPFDSVINKLFVMHKVYKSKVY